MLKVQVDVHLDGLICVDKEKFPTDLPRFRFGEFEVSKRVPAEEPVWLKSGAWYFARGEIDVEKGTVANPPSVFEKIDAFITCFRLFKKGYIAAYPFTFAVPEEEPPRFASGYTARSSHGGMVYPLACDEIPRLVEFGDKVYGVISSGPFASRNSPGFQFYNRGIEDMGRSDYALAIVDFVSCMEALVSTSRTEISHRLSELIALMTEGRPGSRQERYIQCKTLYDKRSRVIHGEKLDDAVKYVNQAEELARATTRFCLGYYSVGKGRDDILMDASNVIFGKTPAFPDFAFSFI